MSTVARPPERPALLVVDPDETRRKALATGLASYGYEVVPTVSAEQGLRYARTLGPAVIVAPAGLAGFDGSVLAGLAVAAAPSSSASPTLAESSSQAPAARRTVVLLGLTASEADDLAEDVLFLLVANLSVRELVRRIRLVLIGREIGVAADPENAVLLGDLGQLSLLELVRAFHRLDLSGEILVDGGEVMVLDGQVVGAAAGPARGIKAFCRLARRHDGPFRIELAEGANRGEGAPSPGAPAAVRRPFRELIFEAIEDVVSDPPDPRLLVRQAQPAAAAAAGAADLPAAASDLAGRLLRMVVADDEGLTVQVLLDSLPDNDGAILGVLQELREAGAVSLEAPRGKLRVVTDSTCDLPADLIRQHRIVVVPLDVLFGNKALRDGIDIVPKIFYELLVKSAAHPSTRPPGTERFLDAYRTVVADRDVLSVHLSAKLSQTVAAAKSASELGHDEWVGLRREAGQIAVPRLDLVDSASVSLGLGLQVLFAARMAERGQSAEAIIARLTDIRQRMIALFVVDTLEYLARGGRIGKARALLGGLLGIKPILGVVNGEVAAVDKVRGGRQAHPKMIELLQARLIPGRPVLGGVVHANAPIWAERLRVRLTQSFSVRELILAEMGPVVGVHAGPGAVGVGIFQPRDDEELELLGP